MSFSDSGIDRLDRLTDSSCSRKSTSLSMGQAADIVYVIKGILRQTMPVYFDSIQTVPVLCTVMHYSVTFSADLHGAAIVTC